MHGCVRTCVLELLPFSVSLARAGLGVQYMDEETALSKAGATDFLISHLISADQHGMVAASYCRVADHPFPNKLYAVKLIFNFTDDDYTSSVLSNHFENEWLLLSSLPPHPHIIKYWCQFVSVIPMEFVESCPQEISKNFPKDKPLTRKGQFIVLDYHSLTLQEFLTKEENKPVDFKRILTISSQILSAVSYLESNMICHLDLKLGNCLIGEGDDPHIVLCDFGSSVQFTDSTMSTQWCHGLSLGGNRAHLCPELLSQYYSYKTSTSRLQQPAAVPISQQQRILCYKGQPSFAVGVLLYEVGSCGQHPLSDYPLNYMKDGVVTYDESDIAELPDCHQQYFDLLKSLIACDPKQRPNLEHALDAIRKMKEDIENQEITGNFIGQEELKKQLIRVTKERDIAKV